MNGFTVIIPACNEAGSIEQTLRSILANRLDCPLQVIVVANGCKDDTAVRARSLGGPVEVIETSMGNKAYALNLGDRAAEYFPRAYVDADIDLSENALRKVAEAFDDPGCRIATPTARHIYNGSNPVLAGYYQLWRSLPYVRKAVMGGGFYAIDAQLRSRFGKFPAIIADDKFMRDLTRPDERRIVKGCYATVTMPETFQDLLKVKTRWTYGNLELAAARPDLRINDQHPYEGIVSHLLARPWLWIHVPAFVFVYVYAHAAARKRFSTKNPAWLRDDSTRPLPQPSGPAG